MKTTLEIVVALVTSILFTGATVGVAILGACTLSAGGAWWLWRGWKRRR